MGWSCPWPSVVKAVINLVVRCNFYLRTPQSHQWGTRHKQNRASFEEGVSFGVITLPLASSPPLAAAAVASSPGVAVVGAQRCCAGAWKDHGDKVRVVLDPSSQHQRACARGEESPSGAVLETHSFAVTLGTLCHLCLLLWPVTKLPQIASPPSTSC